MHSTGSKCRRESREYEVMIHIHIHTCKNVYVALASSIEMLKCIHRDKFYNMSQYVGGTWTISEYGMGALYICSRQSGNPGNLWIV